MGTLLLAGAGHAHMTVMAGLGDYIKAGHEVVVVGPSAHHYYSGMGPGMLGGTYEADDIRFAVKRMVEKRGGRFILDKVVSIDAPGRTVRLSSGRELAYDAASFNVGSSVPSGLLADTAVPGNGVYTVKPIENLMAARDRLRELLAGPGRARVLVVGGGPGALEVAGNACLLGRTAPRPPEVTVLAGKRFLSGVPDKARRLARRSLERRGVVIDESGYAASVVPGRVVLEGGREVFGDVILVAVGIRPPTLFAESYLPVGPDGGLLVDQYLRSPMHPEIFGGGDCIYFAPTEGPLGLDKVGVYAVRQNPVLKHNLMAALEGREPMPFDSGGGYLLIYNLGDGSGVFWKGGLVFGGRLAFYIKDVIDRRFMRRFQR